MSKTKQKIYPKRQQMELPWGERVDAYVDAHRQVEKRIFAPLVRPVRDQGDEFEFSIQVAAAIKRALDASGLSRDQLVDGINEFYGRTEERANADPPGSRKPLTIHMLNCYLSAPQEKPIPAYYLFAIHRVCKSLEPLRVLAEAEGAQVATGEEIRELQLGKLQRNLEEGRKLLKDLKKQI